MAKKQSAQKKRGAKRPAGKAKAASARHKDTPEFRLDLTHSPDKYISYPKKGARLHYFMLLMMLTVFNFLIFLALVPLMIIIKSALLMLILSGIGLVFGMFYLYLIRDIEHMQPRHHLFAGFYIPFISVINIIALFFIGWLFQRGTDYDSTHLLYASALYVAMFLLPYAIAVFFERLWPRKGNII